MFPNRQVSPQEKNIILKAYSTSSFAYSRSRERERMRSEDHYSVVIQWRSSEEFLLVAKSTEISCIVHRRYLLITNESFYMVTVCIVIEKFSWTDL